MPQPPTPPDAGQPTAKAPPGKLFRRFRRTVRALFIVAMVLPVIAVVLTQGPVPKWLVAKSVRRAMGADFDAHWVSLKLDGRFIATDVKVRVPEGSGLPGDAGRIAEAQRVEVELDWSAWAAGVVVPSSVKVVKPVVRLSLDRSTHLLNVAKLTPSATSTTAISRVPRIDIVGGRLIVAEHGADARGADASMYRELVGFDTAGWISPIFGTRRYLVRFSAVNPDDPLMAFDANGEVDLIQGHGEVATSAVDLSRWTPERVPSQVRALWEELRLRGRIAGTVIRYNDESGLDTTITLEDVALNAPIASGRAEITGSRKPRMENVAGTLRVVSAGPALGLHADLSGLFEDLPARVRLDSRGLRLDSAYSAVVLAEKFQLEKNPRILWFAPEVVHENFERFSGPTALIDARIEVSRKPPVEAGVPGDTSIAGTLVFQNGQLSYNLFPYPVVNMTGTVRFEDDTVHIVGFQGRGPTGARMFAEGTIDPPVEGAGYDVRVTATDLPMDSVLRTALDASPGAPLVSAIFSQQRYDELVAKGLVKPGHDGVPPDFRAFSGMIDSLQVHVFCGFETGMPVHQDIAVRFRDVHALPEAFPYPLSGSDVSVRIGDDFVVARGENLSGLHGGSADVEAQVAMVRDNGQLLYVPTVRLKTQNFPIDPLLINAIPDQLGSPGAGAGAPAGAGAFSVKGYLSGLRLEGPVDADISVTPGASPRETPVVTASVVFEGVTAHPDHLGQGTPVALTGLVGAFSYEPRGLTIGQVEGQLVRSLAAQDEQGPVLPAAFRLDGEWLLPTGAQMHAPPGSHLSLTARDLDTTFAIEDLLRPIVPGTAATVAEMRKDRSPSGRADVALTVEQRALTDGSPSLTTLVDAVVTNAENLQIDVGEERVELIQHAGSLGLGIAIPEDGPAAPLRLSLRGLDSDLRLGGEVVGRVAANGAVSLPTEASGDRPATPLLVHEPTDLTVRDLRLESAVVRHLAGKFGGPDLARQLNELNPQGVVDGEVRLQLPEGESNPARWVPWAAVRPRWLAFSIAADAADPARRIVLPLISGQITAGGEPGAGGEQMRAGSLEELTVVDDGWSARFNGRWSLARAPASDSPTPWRIEGNLDFDAQGVPPTLLALLPPSAGEAVRGAKLQVLGGIEAHDTAVAVWSDGTPGGALSYRVGGRASFAGLFAQPGVTIDDAQGKLIFTASRSGSEPSRSSVGLEDAVLRIAGLRITSATGAIESVDDAQGAQGGAARRVFDISSLTGAAYGGRILITAHAEAAGDSPAAYAGSIQLAGIRFADILRDLQRTRSSLEGPRPPSALTIADEDLPHDGSRGLVQAELTLRGTAGDPGSRSGRGQLSIAGGQAVLDLPGVTTLLSIISLQLPDASPFDYLHTDAHVTGGTLYFDRVAMLSDSVAVLGGGTMDIDTFGLDVRMVARGRSRLPLFSDLLDAFRDELVTARLRGTPDKPALTLENFGGVRAAFGGGGGASIGEALRMDLDQLERERQRTLGVANVPWGPVVDRAVPITVAPDQGDSPTPPGHPR